jgi:hypothetical protein
VRKTQTASARAGYSKFQAFAKCRFRVFFERAPHGQGLPEAAETAAESTGDVNDFLATKDGVALVKAFMRISDAKLRRALVQRLGEPDIAA